jgi:plastocyanin
MKLNRALITVLLLGLVLAVVGCSSGGGSTTGGYGTPPAGTSSTGSGATGTTVVEKGFAFDPATLDVKVGDTVTFKNEDSAPHNVSIDGKELGSQDPGASVTWTAAKAGSFPYSCTIHPSMTGEIVVK